MMTPQQQSSTWKTVTFIIAICLTLSPVVAMAQYTPLAPLPCVETKDTKCPGGVGSMRESIDFETYVDYAFNLIIALAAVAAIFMIVVGGFQYMTTDSWTGKSAGLDKARNAVYGLLLVLTSFILLHTIDPRLVQIKTTLVTPLEINYKKLNNDISGFYAQLKKDAEARAVDIAKFDKNIQEANATIQATNLSIDQITDQIVATYGAMGDTPFSRDEVSDLCSQFQAFDTDSPAAKIASLCQQLRQKNAVRATAENVFVLNTAEAAIRLSVDQCGPTSRPDCAKNRGAAAEVTTIVDKYFASLDAESRQHLQSYAAYSEKVIDINTIVVSDDFTSTYKAYLINEAVTDYEKKRPGDTDHIKELKDYQAKIYKENLNYTPPPKS